MKTLRQFLEEALDKPYPVLDYNQDKIPGRTIHEYRFSDHKGDIHTVSISHGKDKPHIGHVSFIDQNGDMNTTGDKGTKSVRIFSTVKHIMHQHAEKNKGLHFYRFSSEKPVFSKRDSEGNAIEDGRTKLYRKFTKSMGGISSDRGGDEVVHTIPIPGRG